VTFAVLVVAAAPVARAADEVPLGALDVPASDAALARYRIGISLYTADRFEEAAREFEVCAAMVPASAKLPYNAARSWERAGDVEAAIRNYRRYLEISPAAPDRAEVEGVLAALEARRTPGAATLVVDSTPIGADVFVDGAPEAAGRTPLRARTEPGRHSLRVELPGHVTVAREVDAAARAETRVDFVLAPVAAPAPAAAWRTPVGWTAVGLAAASAGAAAWLGVAAVDARDEAGALLGEPDRHDRLRDTFEGRRAGAIAAGAAAAALAVTGVLLLW
jgi:tetratricopeptide (TPR) repeat protein